jgi:hypothetical protein
MATMRGGPFNGPAYAEGGDAANRDRAANPTSEERTRAILRGMRQLPRRMEQELKTRPRVIVGAVGGVSFVLGVLVGSRMGRLFAAAALGCGAKAMFDRGVFTDLLRMVESRLFELPPPRAPSRETS